MPLPDFMFEEVCENIHAEAESARPDTYEPLAAQVHATLLLARMVRELRISLEVQREMAGS